MREWWVSDWVNHVVSRSAAHGESFSQSVNELDLLSLRTTWSHLAHMRPRGTHFIDVWIIPHIREHYGWTRGHCIWSHELNIYRALPAPLFITNLYFSDATVCVCGCVWERECVRECVCVQKYFLCSRYSHASVKNQFIPDRFWNLTF